MATHAQRTDQTEQPRGALGEPEAITVLSGEDFDWLLRLLDEPDEPVPALVRAVERERRARDQD